MSEKLTLKRLSGAELPGLLAELARLRITVFREFPYLYDGNFDYEATYLKTYGTADDSIIILASDGDKIVGASTGLPLDQEEHAFQRPFIEAGFDPAGIFYFGESIILPEYRGMGTGHRFFDEREAHARALGRFQYTTFCSVDRPADHPMCPLDYRPLDAFWSKRGYQPHPSMKIYYPWKDIGDNQETEKPLTVWMKEW